MNIIHYYKFYKRKIFINKKHYFVFGTVLAKLSFAYNKQQTKTINLYEK